MTELYGTSFGRREHPPGKPLRSRRGGGLTSSDPSYPEVLA